MQISDEILMAYADGELSPIEAVRVEMEMAKDPALAARVRRFRSVRRALRTVYDDVAKEAVPDRLLELLGSVDAASQPPPSPPPPALKKPIMPPLWMAAVAALVIGVLAGSVIAPAGEPFLIASSGALRAGPRLSDALEKRLTTDADNGHAEIRIAMSFRSFDGPYCRTFLRRDGEGGVSGVACKRNDVWVVDVAGAATNDTGFGAGVSHAVDQLIDGEPLRADEERAARAAHWRWGASERAGRTPPR